MTNLESIDPVRLGMRIREMRQRLRLNQTKAAQLVGFHRPVYARLERGWTSPRLETLEHVVSRFGFRFLDLFTDSLTYHPCTPVASRECRAAAPLHGASL